MVPGGMQAGLMVWRSWGCRAQGVIRPTLEPGPFPVSCAQHVPGALHFIPVGLLQGF